MLAFCGLFAPTDEVQPMKIATAASPMAVTVATRLLG
jgi:hypothetical protein